MYKQCQTEQSAARQREMEQGLLRLMGKVPYDEISVGNLCEEIGVPRKSFYRYFSGKEGALLSLIDHALMDYDVYTTHRGSGTGGTAVQYIQQIFDYWVHHKELLDALEKSNLSGVLIQRAMTFTKDRDALPNFLQISDQRLREYGNMFLVCGLMTMILQWHHDRFYKSSEEMAQLALQLFTQPLFGGKL